MDDDFKRNNIPAFGDWDYADGLPITQYFESARQAGLIRYSCGDQDLYGAVAGNEFWEKPTIAVVPRRKTKGSGNGYPCVKEQKKQASVYEYDVTEPQRLPACREQPKPVDEDLYRIPPELLYNYHSNPKSKRKKRFGFFSRCLMPSCAV